MEEPHLMTTAAVAFPDPGCICVCIGGSGTKTGRGGDKDDVLDGAAVAGTGVGGLVAGC